MVLPIPFFLKFRTHFLSHSNFLNCLKAFFLQFHVISTKVKWMKPGKAKSFTFYYATKAKMWNPNIFFDGKGSQDNIKISTIFTRRRLCLPNLGFPLKEHLAEKKVKKALEAYLVLLCWQIN